MASISLGAIDGWDDAWLYDVDCYSYILWHQYLKYISFSCVGYNLVHILSQRSQINFIFIGFYFFNMCILYVCHVLCVFIYAHVHLCGYKHRDQRSTWVSSPIAFFSNFWKSLSLNPELHVLGLGCLANKPFKIFQCVPASDTVVTGAQSHAQLYHGC